MSSHHVATASSDSAIIKKEEEDNKEEKIDVKNRHGTDVNKNDCDLNNRLVKKEEEEEEETDSKNEDNNDFFEDWKVGNWCWVLPSTATTTATNTSSSHNTSSINNNEDTTPKKKKKKARSLSPPNPHPPSNRNNTNTKREEDSEVNTKMDSDDGYESWTEGNWCLLLPITKRRKQPPVRVKNRSSYTSSSHNSSCVDVEPDSDESSELEKNNFDYDKEDNDNYDGNNTITYTKTHNGKWNEMFQRLTSYKKQHNSTSVPQQYAADIELGRWVDTQRSLNMVMSEYRMGLLNSIGFVWNPFDNKWDKMFNRLVTYKKKHHGSTIVSKRYGADTQLAIWVSRQRWNYRCTRDKLSADRIERLESIDFVWDQWMAMYNRLLVYKKKNKSTQVPQTYTEENQLHLPILGKWVYYQRCLHRNGKLLEKRVEYLNSIDFEWEVGK